MQALMPDIQLLHIEMYSYMLWRLKGSKLRDTGVAAQKKIPHTFLTSST